MYDYIFCCARPFCNCLHLHVHEYAVHIIIRVAKHLNIHCHNNIIIITLGTASNESGRDTPQFKAVLNLRTDMMQRMQTTPSTMETISSLFKEKEWIAIQAECSASCLVDCALGYIQQDPTQFSTLIGMLRKTVGMQDIVEKLISSC